MIDNTDIQPALTADEWKELVVVRKHPSKWDPEDDRGGYTFVLEKDGVLSVDAHWPDTTPEILPADRHALAALALYNQPFGFTPDDLDFIYYHCGVAGESELWGDEGDARFNQIVAKIAALLPPQL